MKIKIYILIIIAIIFSNNLQSQDTIYFDYQWQECNSDNAEYYRILLKQNESSIQITRDRGKNLKERFIYFF
jgi:hypothetical protein